jgi:hypothetical protein
MHAVVLCVDNIVNEVRRCRGGYEEPESDDRMAENAGVRDYAGGCRCREYQDVLNPLARPHGAEGGLGDAEHR